MENDKYYTPDIEEFHIGFEYEYFAHPNYTIDSDIDVKDKVWLKSDDFTDFDDYDKHGIDVVNYYINKDEIRVKYLDKEDVESLGFIFDKEHDYYYFFLTKDKSHRLALPKNPSMNKLIIEFYDETNETPISRRLGINFVGDIKNKSELKRVLKQIGIE